MSELVVIEKNNVSEVFKAGGMDSIIASIKEQVDLVPDVSTAKGRKEIASTAHKIAKSKTYLDGLGKDLVTGIKQQAKVIDAERKKARDQLDALKEEIRKPLTEWEDAEKERVLDIQKRINVFSLAMEQEYTTSSKLKLSLGVIEAIEIDDSFAEFAVEAARAKDLAVTHLKAKYITLKDEEEKAELAAKAEAERIEKERIEREERIAKEAAENARLEAEAKAKAEAEEKEREAKAQIEAAQRAEAEAKLAAERAEREKKEAADNERRRIEAEKKAKEEAEEKRQANLEHRAEIHSNAKQCFIENGIKEDTAVKVITLISKGLIANVSIQY